MEGFFVVKRSALNTYDAGQVHITSNQQLTNLFFVKKVLLLLESYFCSVSKN